MALNAEEQALLDSLTAKASAPAVEEVNAFNSLEKIVFYLVRTSDKFTANPGDREYALSFLEGLINPAAAPDAEVH